MAPEEAETVMAEPKMLCGLLYLHVTCDYPAGKIIFNMAPHAVRHCGLEINLVTKIMASTLNSNRPISPKMIPVTSTMGTPCPETRQRVYDVLCWFHKTHYFAYGPKEIAKVIT